MAVFGLGLVACSGNQQEAQEEHHDHNAAPEATPASKPKSPPMSAMANIGDTHVHIDYHAPSVRGRQIFGGLVAYGEVWVTGAHKATAINFPNNVTLNGQPVAKGKYALFTIPGEQEWTIIINQNYEQHLADEYDAELDGVRFTVAPQSLTETQEQLLYTVEETSPGKGEISIAWANVKVAFEVAEAQ